MMYPTEKYRYYTNGRRVIAVSTYAGKTVRGVATCDPTSSLWRRERSLRPLDAL